MSFSQRVRHERLQRGFSRARLAALLETTPNTVGRWERGEGFPAPHIREKLCALFQLTAEDLDLLASDESSEKTPPSQMTYTLTDQTMPPEMINQDSMARQAPFCIEAIYDPLMPTLSSHFVLVGREKVLADLSQKMCNSAYPQVLALHGLPGVGKTSLVCVLLQQIGIYQHFEDGILWANLGPDANLIEHFVRWSHLLGIAAADIEKTKTPGDWIRLLRFAIGKRRFLIILDDLWRAEDALLLQVGGIQCSYLITTRFPLLAVQMAAPGNTIALPELSREDGINLLARFVPDILEKEPIWIGALVQQVGALPLALTIIARHLQVQAYTRQPQRIQRALNALRKTEQRLYMKIPRSLMDLPSNLPASASFSLYSVIAVSEQESTPLTRTLLRRLAILHAKPNSFSEELVEALLPDAYEPLNNLVDIGLVESYSQGRYTLHQTIADYARINMQAEKAGIEEVRTRLMNFIISWLEKHVEVYEQIEIEYGNILQAIEITTRYNHKAQYIQLVLSLVLFWQVRGWYQEAEQYLQRALALSEEIQDTTQVMRLLAYLGDISERQGKYKQAKKHYQKGIRLTQQTEQPELSILLLNGLATIEIRQGNYDQAEVYCQQGLTITQNTGKHVDKSHLLYNFGLMQHYRAHYSQAEPYYQEALLLAQQKGQRELISRIFNAMGAAAEKQHRDKEAEAYYQEGLAHARQIGHQEYIIRLLNGLGVISSHRRDQERAKNYCQEAFTLAQQIKHRSLICNIQFNLAEIARKQQRIELATVEYQKAFALAHEMEYGRMAAANLVGLGKTYLETGQYTQAEQRLQEAITASNDKEIDIKAMALYTLARVALAQQQIDKAINYAQESLALFESLQHVKATKVRSWLERTYNESGIN